MLFEDYYVFGFFNFLEEIFIEMLKEELFRNNFFILVKCDLFYGYLLENVLKFFFEFCFYCML